MRRYAAIVWDEEHSRGVESARRLMECIRVALPLWKEPLRARGLFVTHADESVGGSKSYLLSRSEGVILGQLFERRQGDSHVDAPVQIDPCLSDTIVRSGGTHLMDRFWGRYVAFMVDRYRGRKLALRDPSGGVLCYSASVDGVHLFFSHVDDIYRLGCARFSTNWDQLLANFSKTELVNGKTGLNEVEEVLAGERFEIARSDVKRTFCWDPRKICKSKPLDDASIAASSLRGTAQRCIDAWASRYDTILHNLSGGLDSAIVLSCLAKSRARANIICLNYSTSTHIGDERQFARLAAQKAGCELIEYQLPASTTKLEALLEDTPLLASPSLYIFGSPSYAIQAEIARERKAQAFTSGEGGDHIFYQLKLNEIAADYLFDHRLNRHALKIVLDTARLNKTSFWAVMDDAIRFGLTRRARDPMRGLPRQVPPFLRSDAASALPPEYALHPWVHESSSLSPGKLAQVSVLPGLLHRHWNYGRAAVADVVHPLFSQPLVELCLRIPSYVLTINGRDRGLARCAFADDLPQEIRFRTSKGATGNYVSRMYVENLPFLREFILDGILAKKEFMDRKRLEDTLTAETIEQVGNLRPLMKLIATEAWLRRWFDPASGWHAPTESASCIAATGRPPRRACQNSSAPGV